MNMRKTLIIIMSYIVMISIIGPSMADPGPNIKIDDSENKVKFQKFNDGDSWNIDLRDTSDMLRYRFDGTIAMDDTKQSGKNWKVWFQCVSPGAEKHGIERIIVPGTYNVYANGTTGGGLIEESGQITIEDISSCGEPISPIPELSTIALMSAGILGIVLVSRKYRK